MIKSRTAYLAIFAKQFAAMMASGLQLVTVLDNLARETPHRKLREAVRDIAVSVSAGTDVAASFAKHPKFFDPVFVGIVRSGLETGCLAESLRFIVEYLERVDQVNRKLTSATVYPLFLVFSFLTASSGMIFFILPKYEVLFASFHHDLPAATQLLLDVGDLLRNNGISIVAALAGCALVIFLVVATPGGKRSWDHQKLRLPMLGTLWRFSALARFSRTFALQVRNHIAVVDSLKVAADSSGNAHVKQLILDIASDVERGQSVTQAFRSREIFAGIVLQMIAAGEEAGRLDELLISAAGYFDSLLLERIDAMTAMINPTLTVVMGLSISGMMVAAFLPVFDLPGVIG